MREREREEETTQYAQLRPLFYYFILLLSLFSLLALSLSLSLSLSLCDMYTYMFSKTPASSKEKDELLAHNVKGTSAHFASTSPLKKQLQSAPKRDRENSFLLFFACICIYVQSCDSYITALPSEQIDFLRSFSIYRHTHTHTYKCV